MTGLTNESGPDFKEGKILSVAETSLNGAEQKKLEEELRLHQNILANMAQGLCLIRFDDATIIYANPKFEKMFGYGTGEMNGRPISLVNAPTDKNPQERAEEILAILRESGEWHGEVENIRKDGTLFWCEANVSIFDHSKYGQILGALHTDITARKQTEQALRESTQRYMSLVEYTDDLITRVDCEGRLLYVNSSSLKYWGLPPEECLGQSAFDFICPDDRARTSNHFHAWLQSKRVSTTFENRQLHSSGKTFLMQWMVSSVRDKGGDVVEFNSIARDISEHSRAKHELKATEKALRDQNEKLVASEYALRAQIEGYEASQRQLKESEERFKALHDASFGGVIIHDKGLILDCNRSLSDITGFANDELIGMDGFKLIAPHSLDLVLRNIRSGYDQQYEVEGVRKDGSVYPLAIRGKNVQYAGREVRVIEFRDISEQKQAEKAMRESEERFRQIFETNPAPLILSSVDGGKILDVNRAFEAATGIPRHQALGHTSEELGLWMNRALRKPFLEQLQGHGEVDNFEADLQVKGGQTRTGLLSARLLNLNNKPCILTIIRDITTEKVAEQALIEMDRMKSEFISAAAHELSTPLSAILGYTELLLDPEAFGGFTEEQKLDFLNEVYDRGEALNGIIDDLLDISRIESGQPIALDLQETDLGKTLSKTVKFFQGKNQGHFFRLELPDEAEKSMMLIDRHRITQVLENLMSNAVKYSPAGSEIVVKGQPRAGGWEIKIEDPGIGMTPEQVDRVFDKFYRADASDTSVSGLGLGMSIARQIVEAHGGMISVESQPGAGTGVCFSLPAKQI